MLAGAHASGHKGVGEFVTGGSHRSRARASKHGSCWSETPIVKIRLPFPAIPNWRMAREKESNGWGQRNDMPDVLSSAHVVCLPSYYREGLPKVLLEAAACGRPLIASDGPGCREIAIHNETALLVPPRNAAALADAMQTLGRRSAVAAPTRPTRARTGLQRISPLSM